MITSAESLKPGAIVVTASGREGVIQNPSSWNAIDLPQYRLVKFQSGDLQWILNSCLQHIGS